MSVTKPFSAKDCINIINCHRKEPKYHILIEIEENWLPYFDNNILQKLLVSYGTMNTKLMIVRDEKTSPILLSDPNFLKTIEDNSRESTGIRCHVARRIASSNILEKFSKDSSLDVVRAVASNPKAPENLLMSLASSKSQSVRAHVARNPSTPLDIVKKLLNDNAEFRYGSRWHGLYDGEYQWTAHNDDDSAEPYYVRNWALENPNIPIEIILELAKEGNYYAKKLAAQNPNTPPDFLNLLARNTEVCYYVIHNPSTPLSTLNELKKNSIKVGDVNDALKKRRGCFIATEIYGSPLNENVIFLKYYRDKILSESYMGNIFIKIYYQISPRMAVFISNHVLIKLIIRNAFLDPLVFILKSFIRQN